MGKLFWLLTVFLGFLAAGYFINDAYHNSLINPVATSISTHPVEDLQFPMVTICPPKGANTALNYDLMKADNNSMTEKKRYQLMQNVIEIFIEQTHEDFVKNLMAVSDIKQIFEGFQKYSNFSVTMGMEMSVWNNNGTVQTPWYGKDFSDDYFKENKQHKVMLNFPENLADQVGGGSLVIQLEVDTRQEEGWQEQVTYWEGKRTQLFAEEKSWSDAESHCQMKGGHLVPVTSQKDQEEMKSLAGGQSVWIGAYGLKTEGSWKWLDGSQWQFTKWNYNRGRMDNCVYMSVHDRYDWVDSCLGSKSFICLFDTKRTVTGNQKITLKYTKEELRFTSFQVQYKYNVSSQELLDSWIDKRMTGFRLRWRIEPAPLELTTSEVGRSIQTPGLGGTFDEASYATARAYKATLLFPEDLADQIANGSLVIELEVDTREEEGWTEEVKHSVVSKYKAYGSKLSWWDAEAYCKTEGGHLASILSNKEQNMASDAASRGNFIWIGGSDEFKEGVWRWSDGSQWGYQRWQTGFGNEGNHTNCLLLMASRNEWWDYSCNLKNPFICKSDTPTDTKTVKGNQSLLMVYNKNQLNFTAFQVQYRYEVSSQEVLDSWQNKRMTGFRLGWFLRDTNGTRLTEIKPDLPNVWNYENAVPRFKGDILRNMVKLARQARINGMSRVQILTKTVQEKANMMINGSFQDISICSHDQVQPQFYSQVFQDVTFGLKMNQSDDDISDEDVKTGFMIFYTIAYCSESTVKLFKFIHRVTSSETLRTIIKTVVNMIEDDRNLSKIRNPLNNLYHVLEGMFNLQLGKILLATVSHQQLQIMIAKDWPYFTQYQPHVNECLNGTNCQTVMDLVNSLGTRLYMSFSFKYCIISGEVERAYDVSLNPPHMIDSNETLNPEVLIPFCAYQTDLTLLSKKMQDFPFPVCSKFQATVLEGQLCYSLDPNLMNVRKTKKGLENGLLLILDPGKIIHKQNMNNRFKPGEEMLSLDLKPLKAKKTLAQVYIHTLASFSENSDGIFGMTALKNMTGTDSFLELSDDIKSCQTEYFEDCQTKRYKETVLEKCGCVPWALNKVLGIEVKKL